MGAIPKVGIPPSHPPPESSLIMAANKIIDPDDMFEDTRMSFGDHIEDLRKHLIRAVVGFLICMIASFFIANKVLIFIARPVDRQLQGYWKRYYAERHKQLLVQARDASVFIPQVRMDVKVRKSEFRDLVVGILSEEFPNFKKMPRKEPELDLLPLIEATMLSLGLENAVNWEELEPYRWAELKGTRVANPLAFALHMQELMQQIKPPSLTSLSVQEPFVVYFKVSLLTGFILGSPWIFYQIWSFIAAGLYPHEKKYVNAFLPFSLGLFLGGVVLCEFFVMDKAVEALLWFNELLDIAPDLRLNEWLGFALFMPLVFGISFQTPLVMFFIQRMGILTVATFRQNRRIAWFLLAVFAAVITPSVDPVSMMLLWLPMGLLYELGIGLCVYLPGKPILEFGFDEPDEQVEV